MPRRNASASAGVTTWPLGVYQRNFKYLVIRQNNSSQKKFCILMAAAQDRTGEAILAYRQAVDRDPRNVEAMRSLSRLYEAQGRRRLALRADQPVVTNPTQLLNLW